VLHNFCCAHGRRCACRIFFCSSFRRKPDRGGRPKLHPAFSAFPPSVAVRCRSEHARSEWPGGHATGVACNPVPSFVLLLTSRASTRLRRAGNFLCLCKESHQRNTPPVSRSPGIRQLLLRCSTSGIPAVACPPTSRACSGGSLTAHPCADSELARIVRATLRAFPSTRSPRHRGPRLGGILPQKQVQELSQT